MRLCGNPKPQRISHLTATANPESNQRRTPGAFDACQHRACAYCHQDYLPHLSDTSRQPAIPALHRLLADHVDASCSNIVTNASPSVLGTRSRKHEQVRSFCQRSPFIHRSLHQQNTNELFLFRNRPSSLAPLFSVVSFLPVLACSQKSCARRALQHAPTVYDVVPRGDGEVHAFNWCR